MNFGYRTKEFALKALLLTTLLFASCIVIFVSLDPYNVFHYRNIRDNGVEPAKQYIKMRYLLDNPGKFDGLLFGSSRVGFINVDKLTKTAEKGTGRWYNMTYAQGVPHEHLENLQVLIRQGLIPSAVMIGVDDIACYTDPEAHKNLLSYMPYPVQAPADKFAYPAFLSNYLTPVVVQSLPIIVVHKGNNQTFREQFYENGGQSAAEDWDAKAKPFDWQIARNSIVLPFTQTDKALGDIAAIAALCSAHNIRLILFTNPQYVSTYTDAVREGYIDFLERLSAITSFYNFSGINGVTTDTRNYLETNHYLLPVGDLIIDRIFHNQVTPELLSQGFGWYVTPENREEFIALLRGQAEQP